MRNDDSWDVTTSVGATALFVAAARALESQKPQPVAVDPYAADLCRAAGGLWADLIDGKSPDHRLHTPFGQLFQSFQGARTKFFDEFFASALGAGVRQAVILAAGLDSRGYRLPWPAGTVVFELDQPKVLEFKRTVLVDHGHAPTAELRDVGIDLRDDWPQALADNGFDTATPSAWIAEGLLMYLPAMTRDQLFTAINGLAGRGSQVALEQLAPADPDLVEAARNRELETQDPHPFWSLVYNEQHSDPVEWFRKHDWDVVAVTLHDYLGSLGVAVPPPKSQGRHLISTISLITANRS
ncbi:class I SAM-dependent methyltransferase [Mycobacterium sp.]|jgi:methyltransferase (TIGR00027 family)|uniref:class I SAM-dependent methyltransferase n=1 Tax=Mycobacterium sp. TaxID=1785 RepID=UPI002D2E197A|nr:class I SAM-dependent methyltransferase [Mycobacterium sp.]HZA12182.1 class I SAM-dependent methyltransferase [Mycobacterium sp.]